MSHNAWLLLLAAGAVIGLVVLIAHFKFPAFLAITLASLFVGVCAGGSPAAVAQSFGEGVGAVLGSIAFVIALGTVLGKMLAMSGGAEQIATRLIELWGPRRAHWTVTLLGFVLGLPSFFSVGLVLLVPIVLSLTYRSGAPRLFFTLPLVAGLSVAHGLVPPHPGPLAAVAVLKADIGKTILYSLLVGLPTVVLCGPLLGCWLAKREKNDARGTEVPPPELRPIGRSKTASFGLATLTVLLPVGLMLGATAADLVLSPDNAWRRWADFAGSPLTAMSVAVLFSFWSFGFSCGFNAAQIGGFCEECLAPVGSILLVVGAGGGFSRVLIYSGVGNSFAVWANGLGISALVLGWILAALMRVATGSATVAITTAAGLLAPMASTTAGPNRELLVLALGAGSLILSHVNDSGFWLVKEYLHLSVTQTLRTWTVIETAISIISLVLVLLLNAIL
jgi:GntP family gluconate:H+ symporter